MNLSVAVLLSFLCTAPASGRLLSRELQGKSAKSPDSSPDSGEGAQSFGELDTSSISGTYAVVLETGANIVSALGVVDYDGDGHLSGSMRFNELDQDNAPDRLLSTTDVTGTYSLESTGLGNQEIIFDGYPVPAGLLVTKAEGTNVHSLDGNFLVPSDTVPGALTRFTMTQRVSNFHTNSLNGKYAYQVIGGPNLGYVWGFIDFDGVEGAGTLTGQLFVNSPQSDSERLVIDTAIAGTYEVEHHGFVTMEILFTDFPTDPVFANTALIVHANGSQGLSLRGNWDIPAPLLARGGLPSLARTEFEYLGPSEMTEVAKTE